CAGKKSSARNTALTNGGSTMTYECLLDEVKDGIATLTLNRPERLNALGGTLRQDLHDAVTRAGADPEVRVMVETAAGKGFCAGGDVKAMGEAKAGQRERPILEKIAPGRDRTLLAMREAPQPIIAAVNGAAARGGTDLALRRAPRHARGAPAHHRRGERRGGRRGHEPRPRLRPSHRVDRGEVHPGLRQAR